ncbi:LysR family transcriptional regulator [Sphingobium sp.]|uniref:LysR family transcriptional regulator n=1 Tax=Sphingobium sp. TaxID=1912891 RepID=UPI003BB6C87A
MGELNLNNIDLNLLVAFEALVIEGHVSRAASRIGVSQPAMSRSLRQLREMFGDALFRRTSTGMLPTPKAIELARAVRPGLDIIAAAVGRRVQFDPSTSARRFVLSMPDMATHLALPRFERGLRPRAPSIDLVVHGYGNQEAIRRIETGQVELAWGVFEHLPPSIVSENAQMMKEVCIVDPANPAIAKNDFSLSTFLTLPHVVVAMNDDFGTPIDTVLETMGLKRRVALRVPHFLPVARLVVGTDMIAVMTEALLDSLPEAGLLKRFAIPLPVEPVMARMIWHQRSEQDPGHIWLRKQAMELMG